MTSLRERRSSPAARPLRVAAFTAAGIAFILVLFLCLTPLEGFLASLGPAFPPSRSYELPEATAASPSQVLEYERLLPSIYDQLSVYNGSSFHGPFHRADERLERKLWKVVGTLKTYDNGGRRLLEAIDRVYLAYHDNGYSGWSWHYPYLDCFKAVALAGKLRREYEDPTLREEALWREAYCYRFRGIDETRSIDGTKPSATLRAQAGWRSDLGRTRELLEQIVDRFPTGAHAAEAAAYLRFGIAEIEKPGGFPTFETWTRLLLRDCSGHPGRLERGLSCGSQPPSASPRERCEALRRVAASGLGNLGDHQGVAVLVSVLDNTHSQTRPAQDSETGMSLQEHVLSALRSLDPRRASELWQELGLPDDLGLFGSDADALSAESIPQLLARLGPDSDRDDDRMAVGLLIETEIVTGEVVPAVVSAYVAGQIDIRAAASILGNDRVSSSLSTMVTALEHHDPEVRGHLALLLGRLAGARGMGLTSARLATARQAEAEARLRDLLDDPDAKVRQKASQALQDLSRPVTPETSARLARLAQDESSP